MTIEFTEEQTRFIRHQLATGRFANEAEVIKHALSLWQKEEQDIEEMRDLFREAHQRNAHLDPDDTMQMIEDEVRAHRRDRNR